MAEITKIKKSEYVNVNMAEDAKYVANWTDHKYMGVSLYSQEAVLALTVVANDTHTYRYCANMSAVQCTHTHVYVKDLDLILAKINRIFNNKVESVKVKVILSPDFEFTGDVALDDPMAYVRAMDGETPDNYQMFRYYLGKTMPKKYGFEVETVHSSQVLITPDGEIDTQTKFEVINDEIEEF
ncbi:MAG: hypothetical protein E7359_03720 [Clostridiales bacterium]|nr:hypothetical protein [Clostridiales bacterium]